MKIVLKDQTEIQGAMVGKVQNMIELTMTKEAAITNISKFMDSDVMNEIEYHSGAWKTIYRGYNHMTHIDNPKEDEMRVWMEGDENSSVSDPIPLFDDMYMPKGATNQNG